MKENITENIENKDFCTTQSANTQFKDSIKKISFIVRQGHFDYNQLKYIFKEVRKECCIKNEKKKQGAKEHLSQEEANKLINYAYELKGKTGLLVKVLLFTAARVNEFVNIQLKDVYLAEKKIFLSTTKGDKPRYVPIFDFYLHELMIYISGLGRDSGYLFESNRNKPYSTRRIQQMIKGLCKETGIQKNITPHRLRATLATWLSEKGVSTELIQALLGHSKLETTQVYTKGSVRNIGDIGSKILIENKG